MRSRSPPAAIYSRYSVHLCRNFLVRDSKQKRTTVAKKLKATRAQESRQASETKAAKVADSPDEMMLLPRR